MKWAPFLTESMRKQLHLIDSNSAPESHSAERSEKCDLRKLYSALLSVFTMFSYPRTLCKSASQSVSYIF